MTNFVPIKNSAKLRKHRLMMHSVTKTYKKAFRKHNYNPTALTTSRTKELRVGT